MDRYGSQIDASVTIVHASLRPGDCSIAAKFEFGRQETPYRSLQRGPAASEL